MKNIFEQLTDLLKKDERLVSQDGALLKNQTQELARKNDPELIKLLLSDKATKQHFFFEVEKTLIFDKEKFIRFISNKQFLPDSYTAFKNKIGLIAGDKYLSENREVVLAWPYKDCVLEGGMTKEDQKRDEIFYNETLAPDDINRLLDPKVFTNYKRIDKDGEHKLDSFRRDEKGTIKDNLIIKGNNLLALASLKKEFAGKVKLIYIDPPYNTGTDSFSYNDSFNHSSWLIFMRNRLEIAKQLLKDDGVIFINIDDKEYSYLKVLCDEIFKKENFLNLISVKTSDPSGHKTVNPSPYSQTEYVLMYSKNKSKYKYEIYYVPSEYDSGYSQLILNKQEEYSKWKITGLFDFVAKKNGYKDTRDANKKLGNKVFNSIIAEYALKNRDNVFQPTAIADDAAREIVEVRDISKNNKNKIYKIIREKEDIFVKDGRQIYFYSSKVKLIDNELTPAKPLTNLWIDVPYNGISGEGGITLKNGKKPEKLLRRIIEISTNRGDIILDFFAGSGTSGAVAHKIDRQYILVEQMDYIHDLPEARLKNVIAGDQSGISKDVNWKGGGDFVYMELAKWNEKWIEKIEKTKTGKELSKLWNEMKDTAFLSYKVDPKNIEANAKDFADLSVADQKKFLIECLDKNQLYVNLSEIKDKEYGVSKEDMELNKKFYGSK